MQGRRNKRRKRIKAYRATSGEKVFGEKKFTWGSQKRFANKKVIKTEERRNIGSERKTTWGPKRRSVCEGIA